jgi:hypothetical protein
VDGIASAAAVSPSGSFATAELAMPSDTPIQQSLEAAFFTISNPDNP